MGFRTRFAELLGKKAKAKIAGSGEPKRIDLNLPLGIRIGSTVKFEQSTFILGGE